MNELINLKSFNLFSILLVISITISNAQTGKKVFKCEKVYEAVKLIDEGKYDESILMLRECEKVDPEEYTYSYEIALAYTYKKEYQNAIDILEKIKKYKNTSADVFQLLGNNYDFLNNPSQAIKTYEEGLKKFPKAGRLYLEKGVIFEINKKYTDAIASYENGIKVDPMFPSNYYRVSKLYLLSNDKLSGLIYGEIFMNLERTTKRTIEISKLLYQTYKDAIVLYGDSSKIDFCDVVINAEDFQKKKFELPLCAIFGKNFILGLISAKSIDLNSLSEIRANFIKNFYLEDYKQYPNVLFEYNNKLSATGNFDAYNHYLFQMGAEEEFKEWKSGNDEKYQKFVDWYTNPENHLKINESNVFISDSSK
jgi:tetratricopeptide (TPR) repeat protein